MSDYSTLSSHVSVHTCSSDYKSVSLDLPSVPKDLQFGGEVGEVIIIRNLSSAVYLNFGATSNTFNVDGQLLLSSDSKTLIEQQQLTLNGFSAVIIQTS